MLDANSVLPQPRKFGTEPALGGPTARYDVSGGTSVEADMEREYLSHLTCPSIPVGNELRRS
jgi:hypothetical protein